MLLRRGQMGSVWPVSRSARCPQREGAAAGGRDGGGEGEAREGHGAKGAASCNTWGGGTHTEASGNRHRLRVRSRTWGGFSRRAIRGLRADMQHVLEFQPSF